MHGDFKHFIEKLRLREDNSMCRYKTVVVYLFLWDGLIIIKDPWINAVFGNPKLNEDTDFRKEKIERIKKIRVEIDTFIENSDKVKLIESKEIKNKSSYLIILKKI
jgi:hypothetical protein